METGVRGAGSHHREPSYISGGKKKSTLVADGAAAGSTAPSWVVARAGPGTEVTGTGHPGGSPGGKCFGSGAFVEV